MNLEPKKPKQDVVFRRIRGRIVPIRQKSKDVATGAAMIAGGTALSIGAGEAAAQLVKAAAAKRVRAKFGFNRVYREFKRSGMAGQGTFDFAGKGSARMSGASAGVAAEAVKTRKSAFRLFKARNIALAVGSLGGAAFISLGLNKLTKHVGDKKLGDPEELTNDVLGGAAAALATTFYYRRLGLKDARMLNLFRAAKTKGATRPFQIPISFKKGGPFGKGGTFRFRG